MRRGRADRPWPERALAWQVHALAFVPARGWLASGGSDGSVRLWRADAGGGLADAGGDGGVASI